jgi:hypothetical protein
MAASLRSITHPKYHLPGAPNLGRIGGSSNHVFLFDKPCRRDHRLAKPKRLMQAVASLPVLASPPFRQALLRTTGMRLVPQPAVMVQE